MATVKAVNKVLDQTALNSLQIQGVVISGQTHGTVSLDKNFHPLRRAIIWMDQRSISQVKKLRGKFRRRLTHITGLPIACSFMVPALWFPLFCGLERTNLSSGIEYTRLFSPKIIFS